MTLISFREDEASSLLISWPLHFGLDTKRGMGIVSFEFHVLCFSI